jgi:hypothetical protein
MKPPTQSVTAAVHVALAPTAAHRLPLLEEVAPLAVDDKQLLPRLDRPLQEAIPVWGRGWAVGGCAVGIASGYNTSD